TDGLLENIGDKELKLLLHRNEVINGDIVQSFQKFCLNKTKDNYSMYLLEIGDKNKKKSHGITISMLTLFLIVLIAGSIVLVNMYSENKKNNAVRSMQNDASTDSSIKGQITDSVLPRREITDGKKDSLPFVEIVNTPESTDKKSKPASASIVKPINDSAKHKMTILLGKKDSSQKRIFISKKNKHAIGKSDSVKQTTDSTSN
ncbi:MAG TPA: hypothetical protein VNV85_03915, partial [Puia sp.]|nr:hypothetical protein [Puia sp.]